MNTGDISGDGHHSLLLINTDDIDEYRAIWLYTGILMNTGDIHAHMAIYWHIDEYR